MGSIFLFSENDDNMGIIWQAGKNECKVIPSLGESVSGHLGIIKLSGVLHAWDSLIPSYFYAQSPVDFWTFIWFVIVWLCMSDTETEI